MRVRPIPFSMWTLAAASLALGQTRGAAPIRTLPRPAAIRPMSAASLSPLTVAPASLGFQSVDPDAGTVSLPNTTIGFTATSSGSGKTWTLTLQAPASAFSSCPVVPVSAVTAVCSSATATNLNGNGGNSSGSCGAPFTLSTSPQVLATGAAANSGSSIAVAVSFIFTDKWSYVAAVSQPCTLSLTYTATVF